MLQPILPTAQQTHNTPTYIRIHTQQFPQKKTHFTPTAINTAHTNSSHPTPTGVFHRRLPLRRRVRGRAAALRAPGPGALTPLGGGDPRGGGLGMCGYRKRRACVINTHQRSIGCMCGYIERDGCASSTPINDQSNRLMPTLTRFPIHVYIQFSTTNSPRPLSRTPSPATTTTPASSSSGRRQEPFVLCVYMFMSAHIKKSPNIKYKTQRTGPRRQRPRRPAAPTTTAARGSRRWHRHRPCYSHHPLLPLPPSHRRPAAGRTGDGGCSACGERKRREGGAVGAHAAVRREEPLEGACMMCVCGRVGLCI